MAQRTSLITGANSGLGFEAAAQLAEQGYDRVILATRSLAKGQAARAELVARVGRDPFETLVVDVADHGVVRAAVETLEERGGTIDFLLLNAGMVGTSEVKRSVDGIEVAMAASLFGHHALALGLLEKQLLGEQARIVIAGSEAARGDVPTMGLLDVPTFAAEHFNGDVVAAVSAVARGDSLYEYDQFRNYALAKVFVAWWVAALARRLPEGMAVMAVSPGSVPDTGAMRHQPWLMRVVVGALMGAVGPWVGLAASVGTGAARYLEAQSWSRERNGQFYASAPGKMIGDLTLMQHDHLRDEKSQEALWKAVVTLTETDLPLRLVKAS